LTTPYHGYLKNLALSLADRWDRHHTALWDGGHIKFWSRRSLAILMKQEGFAVEHFWGCGGLPLLWKSMMLAGHLNAAPIVIGDRA
jgi:2-polyprenyl-6-hydroxyphenyl methylase/3-demethylubiquinone-9 3-methyltransferase